MYLPIPNFTHRKGNISNTRTWRTRLCDLNIWSLSSLHNMECFLDTAQYSTLCCIFNSLTVFNTWNFIFVNSEMLYKTLILFKTMVYAIIDRTSTKTSDVRHHSNAGSLIFTSSKSTPDQNALRLKSKWNVMRKG